MKFTQRNNKWLSRLMLVMALFAQETLAAHVCGQAESSVKQSYSTSMAVTNNHCHEAKDSNVNACLMHCTQSEQLNLDQASVFAVPVADVVLRVALSTVQQQALPPNAIPMVLSVGPPLAIRFCSFLI
jgi:hypothetical protein